MFYKRFFSLFVFLFLLVLLMAQPTVKLPVEIEIDPTKAIIAPGQKSALIITFRIPNGMWLGAKPEEARTPAGTRIKMEADPIFDFGEPEFPEASVEGVPVHVGVTRVYKGQIQVVVPFKADEQSKAGTYKLTAFLTYTPGFNAGKITTHVDEPYPIDITIDPTLALEPATIPKPKQEPVPGDYQVQPKVLANLSGIMKVMMNSHPEGTAFTKFLHAIFLDPPNHGKNIRHVTYPYFVNTIQEGQSIGVGMAVLNATREGVMTGAITPLLYDNEYNGLTFGMDMVTCPAAYHNLQVKTRYAGDDFYNLFMHYENLNLGPNDRFGVEVITNAGLDKRFRFYGIGPNTVEDDITVYGNEELSAVMDFYTMPIEKLRFGLGFIFRRADIREGNNTLFEDNIPFTLGNDRFTDLPGINGATTAGGQFNLVYDGRNQEFNPTKGLYAKFTASYKRITDDKGIEMDDDYGQFNIELRQYFSSLDQKINLLIRNHWTFSTSEQIPFFELASLGGPRSLRAFDKGRFSGQHAFFASMEMRYIVMKTTVMGFPMALQMGAFLDIGQVFGKDGFEGKFNLNPGVSIRFVNYPNVGYVFNIAHGQDGINASGKITLPF